MPPLRNDSRMAALMDSPAYAAAPAMLLLKGLPRVVVVCQLLGETSAAQTGLYLSPLADLPVGREARPDHLRQLE